MRYSFLLFQFVYTEAEQPEMPAHGVQHRVEISYRRPVLMNRAQRSLGHGGHCRLILPAISIILIWNMATTALDWTCSSGVTG